MSFINQIKPITRAAAAGDGSPWKYRLSTTAVLTLNRAKRKAAQEQSRMEMEVAKAKMDAATGNQVWSFNAGLGIIAAPMSYAVDGKQYIALLVGWGGTGASMVHMYHSAMTCIRASRPEDGARAIEIWRHAVDATHDFLSFWASILEQFLIDLRRDIESTYEDEYIDEMLTINAYTFTEDGKRF